MDYGESMAKGFAPAAARNREPILEVLRRVLPEEGVVLEIASGTGEHAAFYSAALPSLTWQPSDPAGGALESIRAWVEDSARANLLSPLELDVTRVPWPLEHADALLCINMIHISPWDATESLFAGAERLLSVGSPLVTYGPYRVSGRHTAPSNAAFDESLRSRDPRWGVRDLDELAALAQRSGFELGERVDMPANNMTLIWRRVG